MRLIDLAILCAEYLQAHAGMYAAVGFKLELNIQLVLAFCDMVSPGTADLLVSAYIKSTYLNTQWRPENPRQEAA